MPTNKKHICVLGLGYIGLPTASMFATNGHTVRGVDINPEVVKILKNGDIHIEEPGLSTVVKAALASKNLTIETTPSEADVFIIAVPTPYRKNEHEIPTADMSYVESAMESILPFIREGNLVILESTSPPGTTRDLIIPKIEKAGFSPGKEIGVAYCPERVIPGQALKELIENDRVIGAINIEWGEKTKALYKSFVAGDIFLTDPTTSEMSKIIENTYRDVNIAFANEVSVLCEKMGINAWEVINIANRHPRVNIHKPGPGVGGHCISVDPWFLVEKFPEETNIIHLARKINDSRPQFVVNRIAELLNGKKNPKVAILGVAYKANVDDCRESPALEVIHLIQSNHSHWDLSIYDSHVRMKDKKIDNLDLALKGADIAVILTAHDEIRDLSPQVVSQLMKQRLILDTHNILNSEKWIPSGFQILTIGTPYQSKKSAPF
ncbi:MAG: nucleotide sugar dehydrogenase, partial [Elusimicrobiota bacterium]